METGENNYQLVARFYLNEILYNENQGRDYKYTIQYMKFLV